ncbi:unnamed protein product, partial [Nesidiocoris tenuis]
MSLKFSFLTTSSLLNLLSGQLQENERAVKVAVEARAEEDEAELSRRLSQHVQSAEGQIGRQGSG